MIFIRPEVLPKIRKGKQTAFGGLWKDIILHFDF